jgi:hypothetical protein
LIEEPAIEQMMQEKEGNGAAMEQSLENHRRPI